MSSLTFLRAELQFARRFRARRDGPADDCHHEHGVQNYQRSLSGPASPLGIPGPPESKAVAMRWGNPFAQMTLPWEPEASRRGSCVAVERHRAGVAPLGLRSLPTC
jgi:hypothetical protein